MSWKLQINFDDGSNYLVDEDFETKELAEAEYESWLESWNVGNWTLMMAGEDYCEEGIEDCDIWEE